MEIRADSRPPARVSAWQVGGRTPGVARTRLLTAVAFRLPCHRVLQIILEHRRSVMKRVAAMVCLLAVVGLVRAADKPNPTGTWRYTTEVNGQSFETTIKLKLDGDKLTGTVTARDV